MWTKLFQNPMIVIFRTYHFAAWAFEKEVCYAMIF